MSVGGITSDESVSLGGIFGFFEILQWVFHVHVISRASISKGSLLADHSKVLCLKNTLDAPFGSVLEFSFNFLNDGIILAKLVFEGLLHSLLLNA